MTRKNERVCVMCKRPFWAWDTKRDKCRQCDPVPLREAKRVVEAIQRGEVRL